MSRCAVSARAFGGSLLLALFGAIACSGSDPDDDTQTQQHAVSAEVSACIEGHPAGVPLDVGDVVVASPMSGATAPTPPTAETFAAECRADAAGTGCDESFLSLEAARCIAQDAQFRAGLEAWTIALTYNDSYHRVVWGVENLLVDNGPDGYSGESLTVDAVNGRVLGRTTWSAVQ
ncbi:MAG: hypothetical protein RL685_2570 [Pseudomonadota bacterium]|jgi:hypothetical protein